MVGLGPRQPPSRKGSMHDVPQDLLAQMHDLEEIFKVDGERMQKIVDRFVRELEKGLSKRGGNIPMIPTWVVGFASGAEQGHYLAIDLGGTNLRVCEFVLQEGRKFDVTQSKYKLPEEMKTGSAEALFDYMAECIESFLVNTHEGQDYGKLHLGFTFSYPCSQDAIDHGVLQRWTKGFDIDGVEGHDVVPMFEKALAKKGMHIRCTALINDTTGTLIASNYENSETQIGCIFGTGCNAAYMESTENIPKLEHLNLPSGTLMAINCEWGAFDNEHRVLPRTNYDVIIDEESPRPGQQSFEKMIAGLYLGEIFRLVLIDMHQSEQVHIFQGQDVSVLRKPYSMDASVLADIEADPFENLSESQDLLQNKLGLTTTEPERKLIRKIAELIGTRAARLSACGIAAICKRRSLKSCHVGADGSVFNKYPFFKRRQAAALREIFGWGPDIKEDPVQVIPAQDGSGLGAALVAAITVRRVHEGVKIGVSHADQIDD